MAGARDDKGREVLIEGTRGSEVAIDTPPTLRVRMAAVPGPLAHVAFFMLDGGGGFHYPWRMSNAKGADKAAAELQDLPFEDALQRLETIVESMEAQDLPLETLLARYEEEPLRGPAKKN